MTGKIKEENLTDVKFVENDSHSKNLLNIDTHKG